MREPQPRSLAALAAGLVLLLACPGAHADGWGGTLLWSSDKLYRGLSESAGRPVLQLDLDRHTDTGWAVNAGVAGPVYPDEDGTVELALGLSKITPLSGAWTLRAALEHHAFPGGEQARAYARTDASLGLDWQGRFFVSFIASPDVAGDSMRGGRPRRGWVDALEVGWHQRLAGRIALDAGLGFVDESALRDTGARGYGYASLGLSGGLGPLQFYLSRVASQAESRGIAWPSQGGARWAASVVWSY